MDREPGLDYDVDPDAEREVPIDDEAELELPPPTIDPDERIEEPDVDEGGAEDDRPV